VALTLREIFPPSVIEEDTGEAEMFGTDALAWTVSTAVDEVMVGLVVAFKVLMIWTS